MLNKNKVIICLTVLLTIQLIIATEQDKQFDLNDEIMEYIPDSRMVSFFLFSLKTHLNFFFIGHSTTYFKNFGKISKYCRIKWYNEIIS